jgi:hypothetical protein
MAAASAGSLSGIGTLYAWEFDDENGTNFSITGLSTAYASEFDENTSATLTSTQRMRVTSSPTGNVIVYDSINEIDPFGEIPTDGLQVHLDSVDSGITSTTSGGGASSAAFNFRYHAYGADTGDTTVYWYNTTTSTLNTLTTISGEQHTSNTDEWDAYSLDLSSYSGETGRIVIRYSTGGGFNQDPALDEMELVDTTSGTINLDPSNTQPNGGWEQQGGNSSTYPTSGYSALTTNQENAGDYWQYDTNGTPSGSSGPDQDFNDNGTTTPDGYYIYFEGSSPNNQTGVYGWLQTSSTYTLNSGSTTTYYWEDISGNNRDATFIDVAGDPRTGNFINFDGTDDYAATNGAGTGASAYSGVTGTGARTSVIFLKVDIPDTNYKPLAWGDANTGAKWTMAINTSNLTRGEIAGAAVEQPSGHSIDVTDGNWHMWAISAPASGTAADIQMWLDGVEVTGLTVTSGTTSINTASTNYFSVGGSLADTNLTSLDGQIAKVLVYNRQLSDLEMKIIYRSILNRLPWSAAAGGGGGGGGGSTPDLGLSASLLQLTGISASYTQQTVDLSAYANATIRLVWRVVVGLTNPGDNVYENDVQIDTIAVTGGTQSYNFDSDDESFQTSTDGTTDYASVSFASIGASDTDLYWCRNSGDTPSNGTGGAGAQSGSFYLYTETSSPTADGDAFWLRSPEITLDSTPGNCTFYEARDITGANTTLDFYVDVISV